MARFPKGTVTFLCATLDPAAGIPAELLRKAIKIHGGTLVADSTGLIAAAFSSTPPAISAALSAQRHIRASATPPGVGLALHRGRAQERQGSYPGPTFSRALSILDAAHPGQILLSATIAESASQDLPAGSEVRPLGTYRLKDLLYAEPLYQLIAPDLPGDFPPLQTLDSHPHNLPIQSTPLIGREQEVQAIGELLGQPATRLVTLLGSSGSGKTRLAVQVAVEQIDTFGAGVYFVALAPISTPELVMAMIIHALNIKEQGAQPLVETLASALQDAHMLLVLDNFEQVLPAAAEVQQLLAVTRHLKIMVTTQLALDLPAEQVFPVPPLAMPPLDAPLSLDALSQVPAVALFVERARAMQPSFVLTEEQAPAVSELCARLAGLPLAIELVAAQSKRYFPNDMLVLLQNHLAIARTSGRGNTREEILRPVLDWICTILGSGVAGLFARLGVFAGGCTGESAVAICNPGDDLELDVLATLGVLLDHHLLLREELKADQVRYTMLDAVQDYARQRLDKRRETTRFQELHATFYTALAEQAEVGIKSAEQETWLTRLERTHHNLRAALTWTLANNPLMAVRLGGALMRFWYFHAHYSEGRRWLQAIEPFSTTAPLALRAKLFHSLGVLTSLQADYATAATYYGAALDLRREIGDTSGVVGMLSNLGLIAQIRGEYEQSADLYTQGVVLCREINDQWNLAVLLNNLGMLSYETLNFARVPAYYDESLALSEEMGDTWGRSTLLVNLGMLAYQQGNDAEAETLSRQSLALAKEINDEALQSEALEALALLSLRNSDLAEAQRLLADSMLLIQKHGEQRSIARALGLTALLASAQGQAVRVATLFGAYQATYVQIGAAIPPLYQTMHAPAEAQARQQLSPEAYQAAWEHGQSLAPEAALAYALEETRN